MKTKRTLSSSLLRAVAVIAGTAAVLIGHSGNTVLAAPPRPETPAPVKAVKPTRKPAAASATPAPPAPSGPQDETGRRLAAVLKSLVTLQKGAVSFSKLSGHSCQSCHHQMLPVLTLAVARERGLPVNEEQAKMEHAGLDKMVGGAEAMLAATRTDPAAQKSMDTADTPLMLGYILTGFAREKRAPDANTSAMAGYLLRAQRPNGSFPAYGTRVPMEGSTFTSTALVVRALQAYTPQTQADAAKAVIARAQIWLAATTPRTNEDRVFRLLGLKWSGADDAALRRAADDLLAAQNDDGGWSQLPGQLLSSDAYATGQALVALAEGGDLPIDEPAWQRGVNYLMAAQRPDGAWLVKKRCLPLVPYFDADFPGGHDQFISYAGTCWATMAIMLSLPPKPTPGPDNGTVSVAATGPTAPAAK